jgi:hypothetical protein
MPALGRVIPWLVLGFALIALLLGVREWLHPPFTDAQLLASRVETWEVARSTTRVFAIVFLGLGLLCVALARRAPELMTRCAAFGAATACLLVIAVSVRNHVVLTQRLVGMTHETVGPLFGLL